MNEDTVEVYIQIPIILKDIYHAIFLFSFGKE